MNASVPQSTPTDIKDYVNPPDSFTKLRPATQLIHSLMLASELVDRSAKKTAKEMAEWATSAGFVISTRSVYVQRAALEARFLSGRGLSKEKKDNLASYRARCAYLFDLQFTDPDSLEAKTLADLVKSHILPMYPIRNEAIILRDLSCDQNPRESFIRKGERLRISDASIRQYHKSFTDIGFIDVDENMLLPGKRAAAQNRVAMADLIGAVIPEADLTFLGLQMTADGKFTLLNAEG